MAASAVYHKYWPSKRANFDRSPTPRLQRSRPHERNLCTGELSWSHSARTRPSTGRAWNTVLGRPAKLDYAPDATRTSTRLAGSQPRRAPGRVRISITKAESIQVSNYCFLRTPSQADLMAIATFAASFAEASSVPNRTRMSMCASAADQGESSVAHVLLDDTVVDTRD
jgi:hypothetical protein